MAETPINWPLLYYVSNDPELHGLADSFRDALNVLGVMAIEWSKAPTSDEARDRVLAAATTLRGRKERLDKVGARLWAEHQEEAKER